MLDLFGIGRDLAIVYEVAVTRVVWEREDLADEVARSTQLTLARARECVDGLVDAELLREAEAVPGALRVPPPALALRPQLALQRAELATLQRSLDEAGAGLARLQDEYTQAKDLQAARVMEHVVGIDALRSRLEQMAAGTRRETLSLLPALVLTPESIESSRALDLETLGRGVAVRTVVVRSAAQNRLTAGYLRWLSDQGAEIRTVAALPLRMVVSDRVSAVLPIDAESPRDGALIVRAPGLLTALVAFFELVWRDATPLSAPRAAKPIVVDEINAELVRVLATGATDEAASRHLGVSVRTIRRLVSALMTQLGAGSRFELGLRLGARGWDSDELREPEGSVPQTTDRPAPVEDLLP